MTKVLVGIDPNDYRFMALERMNDWVRQVLHFENVINGEKHLGQYFVEQDWLPYTKNGKLDPGDWDIRYFDGTVNQAFHFWFLASSAYFDGDIWSLAANVYHDPYFLEDNPFTKEKNDLCGNDLSKWLHSPNGFLSTWADHASMTSKEDFALGVKGLQFGHNLRNPFAIWFNPGNWIRQNLKNK